MENKYTENMAKCGNCNGTGIADCSVEYGGPCPEEGPACCGSQKVVCGDCDSSGEQEI